MKKKGQDCEIQKGQNYKNIWNKLLLLTPCDMMNKLLL